MSLYKAELIRMLNKKSVVFSQEPVFKLVSGKFSDFYVNCKPTTLNSRGIHLVGFLILNAIKEDGVVAVGGLTFGADPIAVATAFAAELNKTSLQAFSVRKEKKDHGISKWIEGDLAENDRVAIIEDVVTTGGSTIKAIERVRSENLEVASVVVLVDRQEGGVEEIRKYVDNVHVIISRDELENGDS